MELLLNLAWLLLALPAYWLWRRSTAHRVGQNFRAMQCLLALGCALVVLFPVVSVTDDLRAMRTEMEESPATKRNIRLVGIDRAGVGKWQNPAIVVGGAISFAANDEKWLKAGHARLSTPVSPAIERVSRGPPALFLLG